MILNSCDLALCKSKINLVKQKRRNPQLQNTERFPLVVRTSNAWLPFFVLQGHAVYSVEIDIDIIYCKKFNYLRFNMNIYGTNSFLLWYLLYFLLKIVNINYNVWYLRIFEYITIFLTYVMNLDGITLILFSCTICDEDLSLK